jgi:S-adenosylmethionine:tRNA ribosyltransferase-isomerase
MMPATVLDDWVLSAYEFDLPDELIPVDPPEERGAARDDVRLMVADRSSAPIFHRRFTDLPDLLEPGDLLVVNTSGTLPAALDGVAEDGTALQLHLSTHLPGDLWTVELRRDGGPYGQSPGRFALPGAAHVHIHAPYVRGRHRARLWLASLHLDLPPEEYLFEYGRPISYGSVGARWGIERYQTIFAAEFGSAEMPSAGRAFSHELVTRLGTRGVGVVPIMLHAGVSSPEFDEPPYEEQYAVPEPTATAINSARAAGGRVVAVGTTVVRALQTVTDASGIVHPASGWTDVVVGSDDSVRAIDGLLTGWHEPRASHLMIVEAIGGRTLLERSYSEALEHRYLWHEFGDLHLILPRGRIDRVRKGAHERR